MKWKSTPAALSHGVVACACGLALLASAGAVFADGPTAAGGGNVTAISVTPNRVSIGQQVSVKVDATGGGIGVDCTMRWDALEGNTITVGADHKMHKDGANSTNYSFPLSFSKAGVYTLRAHGGTPDGQTASCGGDVNATLTVKELATLVDKLAPVGGKGPGLSPLSQPPVGKRH